MYLGFLVGTKCGPVHGCTSSATGKMVFLWCGLREAKETLIKFSLSTASSYKVAPDELADQAKDTGDDDRL
jgi:hypothetical protein